MRNVSYLKQEEKRKENKKKKEKKITLVLRPSRCNWLFKCLVYSRVRNWVPVRLTRCRRFEDDYYVFWVQNTNVWVQPLGNVGTLGRGRFSK